MTARRLAEGMSAFRIGDPRGAFPIFHPGGSIAYPGRWNDPAHPVIYASHRFSTALLEKLVHGSGGLPPNQHYVEITIQKGVSYEVFQPAAHPGWDLANGAVSRAFGARWCEESRSAILLAPSVVARLDDNVIINPRHPDFTDIAPGLDIPVYWDARLFP